MDRMQKDHDHLLKLSLQMTKTLDTLIQREMAGLQVKGTNNLLEVEAAIRRIAYDAINICKEGLLKV